MFDLQPSTTVASESVNARNSKLNAVYNTTTIVSLYSNLRLRKSIKKLTV